MQVVGSVNAKFNVHCVHEQVALVPGFVSAKAQSSTAKEPSVQSVQVVGSINAEPELHYKHVQVALNIPFEA